MTDDGSAARAASTARRVPERVWRRKEWPMFVAETELGGSLNVTRTVLESVLAIAALKPTSALVDAIRRLTANDCALAPGAVMVTVAVWSPTGRALVEKVKLS